MIPVTTFAGKKVAVFGLGGSGLASASALLAGGADVVAFDDDAAKRDESKRGRNSHRRSAPCRLEQNHKPGARARRAADPSGAALGRGTRAKSRRRGDRRYRIVLPRAPASRARCAVRRHHRHQRQIDDHGADRPPRRLCWNGCAARRQYRHRDPVAGAAAASAASTSSNARPIRSISRRRSIRRSVF